MAAPSPLLSRKRYAVVTGGNKGIGFEICRQLASQGVVVVSTTRDVKRGLESLDNLKKSGLSSDTLEFHQLDVTDPASIASLSDFIRSKFGKLDILVNNAGVGGAISDFHALLAAGFGTPGVQEDFSKYMLQTYELTEECLKTNYYGVKNTTEALLPFLQLSDSPRIVVVSSSAGKLQHIPSERVRKVLGNVESLSEETIDELLNEFLRDFKDGSFATKGWPSYLAAYIVSKAVLNAYTRILAKKHSSIIINCICPGFVKTDMTGNTGAMSTEEGAASPVRYAVVTGANKGIGLEICRQLASLGVMVVLTARNESKGIEAIDNLKKSGIDPHNLEFHQLDVTLPATISSLAHFIRSKFGKLDILVNNAGIIGATVDFKGLTAVGGFGTKEPEKFSTETYEQVVECLETNYYGVKRTIEALLPLLQMSDSPRIVNVSSSSGKLTNIPSERIRENLSNMEKLTEEKIDEIVAEFHGDFKEGALKEKGWPVFVPTYIVTKAALNSYTRILAKKYPTIIINCLCPGYIKTDINDNCGPLPVEEGGASCIRLALLPRGSNSDLFFFRNDVTSF